MVVIARHRPDLASDTPSVRVSPLPRESLAAWLLLDFVVVCHVAKMRCGACAAVAEAAAATVAVVDVADAADANGRSMGSVVNEGGRRMARPLRLRARVEGR